MNKTIMSVFVTIILSYVSANRLLLQMQAPFVPVAQPSNPSIPPPMPIPGQQPMNPGIGQQPMNPGFVAQQPINPGIGQQPMNPGFVGQQPMNPGAPIQPINPVLPGQPGQQQPAGAGVAGVWIPPTIPSLQAAQQATVMECTLRNTDPMGCAGKVTTVKNAGRNYAMKCSNIGACAGAQINFDYINSFTERVEMVSFSEMYSGYGATITIDSTQSLQKQYIDKLECKAYGSCQNAIIKLVGGASLNDVDCPYPNYCQNCNIEQCHYGPMGNLLCGTPKPCFGY